MLTISGIKNKIVRVSNGGIYERGKNGIFWVWWTEPVRDPRTGKVRQKKKYASTQSTRRVDAVTLLGAKLHQAKIQKPALDLPDPTYEEVRDLWLGHRETELAKQGRKPDVLKNGDTYFQGRTHLNAFFGGKQARYIDTPDIESFQ